MINRMFTIVLLLFSTNLFAQQPSSFSKLVGKKFVSNNLDYLEVLNDSVIVSSFILGRDTANYFVRNDTLLVKDQYIRSYHSEFVWVHKLYDYKIVAASNDTIQLLNPYRYNDKPFDWQDTLNFVNIAKLKDPVNDFNYIQLDYFGPWYGQKNIHIDRFGTVIIEDRPRLYSINDPSADTTAKHSDTKGKLTTKEFNRFKDLLSVSLLSKLVPERPCTVIDGPGIDFEIVIGKKNISSKGCDLSFVHSILLNYLFDIDQNKGLKRYSYVEYKNGMETSK